MNPHQLHPNKNHKYNNPNLNPYYDSSSCSSSSSNDEENTLLSQIDDAYSQASITSHASSTFNTDTTPSYISQQRQSFCCNLNSNSVTPSYTKSRRALNKLLKSRKNLEVIETELENEKKKGRLLIFACVCMCIICGILFMDRWPEDWRGSLIHLLEKGRPTSNSATASASASATTGKKNVKDPLEAFRSQDDDDDGGDNDDDSHYSKYGKAYDNYKQSTQNKHKKHDNNDDEIYNNNNHPKVPSEKDLIEENEQSHIDNLSKYLKWNLPYKRDRDIPVFWHIPLTGTTLVDEILSLCYNLVQAVDDVSLLSGHEKDNILNVVSIDSKRYINVDMGSISGIKRAKELHLARSGTVELIRTSYIYEAALLFENTAKYGKCMTLMRDPVQRSIDVFYKLKQYSTNQVFKSMTLNEYVKSSYVEDNWMVRVLSNEMEGELKKQHLDLAQHILGRKFIVGLTDDFEESVRRFAKYFHWDESVSEEKVNQCKEKLQVSQHITNGDFTSASGVEREETKVSDEIHKVLQEKNKFDIELYKYAQGLHKTQALYSRLL